MNECCARYIRGGLDLIAEWADGIKSDPFPDMAEGYRGAILDHAQLLRRIFDGEPCPWHDGIPVGYLAVMAALKGDTDALRQRYEANLRAIREAQRDGERLWMDLVDGGQWP